MSTGKVETREKTRTGLRPWGTKLNRPAGRKKHTQTPCCSAQGARARHTLDSQTRRWVTDRNSGQKIDTDGPRAQNEEEENNSSYQLWFWRTGVDNSFDIMLSCYKLNKLRQHNEGGNHLPNIHPPADRCCESVLNERRSWIIKARGRNGRQVGCIHAAAY